MLHKYRNLCKSGDIRKLLNLVRLCLVEWKEVVVVKVLNRSSGAHRVVHALARRAFSGLLKPFKEECHRLFSCKTKIFCIAFPVLLEMWSSNCLKWFQVPKT